MVNKFQQRMRLISDRALEDFSTSAVIGDTSRASRMSQVHAACTGSNNWDEFMASCADYGVGMEAMECIYSTAPVRP